LQLSIIHTLQLVLNFLVAVFQRSEASWVLDERCRMSSSARYSRLGSTYGKALWKRIQCEGEEGDVMAGGLSLSLQQVTMAACAAQKHTASCGWGFGLCFMACKDSGPLELLMSHTKLNPVGAPSWVAKETDDKTSLPSSLAAAGATC